MRGNNMVATQIEYTLDLAQLDDRVEVLLNVTDFHYHKPNRNSRDSDYDYHGWSEISYDILHLDGTPAPELEALLSKADKEDIEIKIIEEMGDD
jgi:hypothetical protein